VGDRDECSPAAGLADAEGNRYTVSKFGGACWMTQNLRSTYTIQGNQRQDITEDLNILNDNNAVSYYYPNNNNQILTTNSEYGLLYTWGAANIGTVTTEAVNAFPNKPSDRQGICPEGWVIPSDYDWNRLEEEIATNPSFYSSQTVSFPWNVMYEGLTGWRPGEGNSVPEWWGRSMKSPTKVSTTATNGVSNIDGTGFNALSIGNSHSDIAYDYDNATYLWSGSASSATAAWARYLYRGYSGMSRGTSAKYYMFSVRCKKQ
jgi:uncharacterized protein (TIGR02145 family)